MLRVGYLGPPGTFCEQALLTQEDLAAGELVSLPTITDVIETTVSGDVTSVSCRSRTHSKARSTSPSTR